jgi:DNA-binding GntR family transcriptional regulator
MAVAADDDMVVHGDPEPRRSARVRGLNLEQLAASFETLGKIEGICARYAAERMTQSEWIKLEQLMQQSAHISGCGDRIAARELDLVFHLQIHLGTHNDALCSVATDVRTRVAFYSAAPYTLPNLSSRLHRPHGQHGQIAEAIVARDPDRAQMLMRHHIGECYLTIEGIVRDRQLSRARSGEPDLAKRQYNAVRSERVGPVETVDGIAAYAVRCMPGAS